MIIGFFGDTKWGQGGGGRDIRNIKITITYIELDVWAKNKWGVGYSEPSNGAYLLQTGLKMHFFVWYRQWLVEALEQNTTTCPEIFLVGSKKDLCVSTVLLLFFSLSPWHG